MKKIIFTLVVLISFSCEKELPDVLPPFESQMVVNSVIRPDTLVSVFLSNSVSILSDEAPKPVTGATIRLFENDILIGELNDTTTTVPSQPVQVPNSDPLERIEGFYFIEYIPQINATYKLEVEHPDYPNVSASTFIPNQTSNFSVTLSEPRITFYNDNFGVEEPSQVEYTATITIHDAPIDNYYEIAVISETPDNFFSYDENQEPIEERRVLALREVFYTSSDPVFDQAQNPLIQDDHNEFFSRYASNPAFDDELFKNQSYSIGITFNISVGVQSESFGPDGREINEVFSRFFIEARSLSEDLYLYDFTTLLQASAARDPFAEPVQIYSNIENGIGIFGGYNVELFEFSLEEFFPEEYSD